MACFRLSTEMHLSERNKSAKRLLFLVPTTKRSNAHISTLHTYTRHCLGSCIEDACTLPQQTQHRWWLLAVTRCGFLVCEHVEWVLANILKLCIGVCWGGVQAPLVRERFKVTGKCISLSLVVRPTSCCSLCQKMPWIVISRYIMYAVMWGR